jgi:hypothetical protein
MRGMLREEIVEVLSLAEPEGILEWTGRPEKR